MCTSKEPIGIESVGNHVRLEVEIECGLETAVLSELEWFVLSGGIGTPRKDWSHRRVTWLKSWIMELCTWIGKKSYQSIAGIYSNYLPITQITSGYENPVVDAIKEMNNFLEEMNEKQQRMEKENQMLREDLTKIIQKIGMLEGKIRIQESLLSLSRSSGVPPPPPPLIPPLQSSCGSAARKFSLPLFTITPEDIANVRLRKTKDNPVRSKLINNDQQPIVTPMMLLMMKAKLSRVGPIASSSPKKEFSELGKFSGQDLTVTSPQELGMRPYPTARGPRSSRSRRSISLPRSSPLSPSTLSYGTETRK